MNYKIVVERHDNTVLNLQVDTLEKARAIAQRYNDTYAYNVSIVECRVVYMRRSYQKTIEN